MKLDSMSADKIRRGKTRQSAWCGVRLPDWLQSAWQFLIAIQVYNTIVGMWILATEVCLSCLHSQTHRVIDKHWTHWSHQLLTILTWPRHESELTRLVVTRREEVWMVLIQHGTARHGTDCDLIINTLVFGQQTHRRRSFINGGIHSLTPHPGWNSVFKSSINLIMPCFQLLSYLHIIIKCSCLLHLSIKSDTRYVQSQIKISSWTNLVTISPPFLF